MSNMTTPVQNESMNWNTCPSLGTKFWLWLVKTPHWTDLLFFVFVSSNLETLRMTCKKHQKAASCSMIPTVHKQYIPNLKWSHFVQGFLLVWVWGLWRQLNQCRSLKVHKANVPTKACRYDPKGPKCGLSCNKLTNRGALLYSFEHFFLEKVDVCFSFLQR